MFIAGKWCAYEIALICVATLVSVVIMYAQAQSAHGSRVPRWLLALTFVADNNSVVDTLDKDGRLSMPMNTPETKVWVHNQCFFIFRTTHFFRNVCGM
jgi:hypothetical protein